MNRAQLAVSQNFWKSWKRMRRTKICSDTTTISTTVLLIQRDSTMPPSISESVQNINWTGDESSDEMWKDAHSIDSPKLEPFESTPDHNRRKSVAFASRVRILKVPHRSDFTEQERLQLWMTDDELKDINTKAIALVDQALQETGKFCRATCEGDDCIRGLESHLSDLQARRTNMALKTVFYVQDMQRQEGIRDSEWLASVYRTLANPCILDAHTMGLRDQQEILGD